MTDLHTRLHEVFQSSGAQTVEPGVLDAARFHEALAIVGLELGDTLRAPLASRIALHHWSEQPRDGLLVLRALGLGLMDLLEAVGNTEKRDADPIRAALLTLPDNRRGAEEGYALTVSRGGALLARPYRARPYRRLVEAGSGGLIGVLEELRAGGCSESVPDLFGAWAHAVELRQGQISLDGWKVKAPTDHLLLTVGDVEIELDLGPAPRAHRRPYRFPQPGERWVTGSGDQHLITVTGQAIDLSSGQLIDLNADGAPAGFGLTRGVTWRVAPSA